MSSSAIGDLFASPAPKQPEKSNLSGVFNLIAVVALAVVLVFLLVRRNDVQPTPVPDDQKQEQKDAQPAVKGKTLIFIHEKNPQSIEHDLLLREMDKWTNDRKLQYRSLDDDLPDDPVPDCLAFAKTKGIDSPFVILTDQSDKPVRVIKWPVDLAGLEELLK